MPCTAELNIDTSQTVLVTGGTGYIAGVLIESLLSKGLTVHTTVRDPSNTQKLQHLKVLDNKYKNGSSLEFFKADLLDKGSFAQAMEGCSIVFHVASPHFHEVKIPQKELFEPAVRGTENVLNQATQTPTVKRVILTSSALTICGDAIDANEAPGGVFSEAVWNSTNNSLKKGPYAYSKVMAEHKAWELAGSQTQWKLVVVNPGFVMGPGVTTHPTAHSFQIMKQIGDGTMAMGCPAFPFGVVDVRDVAEAHLAAAFLENASGRYLVNACNSNLYHMAENLKEKYGNDYALPRGTVSKWLLWILAPYLGLGLTRQQVWNNVDIPFKIDNTKSKKELFMTYIEEKQSCEEMFQQMIDAGMVQPKKK